MRYHQITVACEVKNLMLCHTLCTEIETSGLAFDRLDPEPFLQKADDLAQKGVYFMDHKKVDVRGKCSWSIKKQQPKKQGQLTPPLFRTATSIERFL